MSPLQSPSHLFTPNRQMGRSDSQHLWGERFIQILLALAASVPILTTLAIFAVFIYQAWLFFQNVPFWRFLTDREWTPLFANQEFGIVVIASATLTIATIAMIVAIPLGVLAAIYLSEYASPLVRRILKPTLEALSGVPTIVYGYFALLFVTPLLQQIIPSIGRFSALSAGLVTGILITPIIVSISEDAISNVPRELREGGYALGFTKREAIIKVIVPVAFPGMIAAFILAASRAFGETIIATIAAGQYPQLTFNPLVPIESMTAFIIQVSLGDVAANSFVFHTLFTVGLVLFLITLSLNWFGHWLIHRHSRVMADITIPRAEALTTEINFEPNVSTPSTSSEYLPTAQLPTFNSSLSNRNWFDQFFVCLTLLAALLGLIIFGLLSFSVFRNGLFHLDWDFLTSFPSRKPEDSGIYAALAGTLWLLMLTGLFAFPIGVGAAIYLEEYLPKNSLSDILEINLANVAAVPSILYGLLGLALFVRKWQPLTGGRSLLSAALMLTVIVLPILIITTRTTLRMIPTSLRQAGYAVGMTRWQVIRHILLPVAFPGITTGMLLALSRAIGETAPLVAIGAVAYISFIPSFSLEALHSSFTTLPTQIFYWISRPQAEFHALAAAAIIVLGGIVLLMNIVAVLVRDLYRQQRVN